jgi:glycosyltransferase involved in cell wall biosynthesis
MRVVILDPAIRQRHGHHDHFVRGLLREAEGYACSVEVLASRRVEPELRQALGAQPVFRISQHDVDPDDPYAGELMGHFQRSKSFAEDLSAASFEIRDDDLLIMPSAAAAELAGLGVHLRAIRQNPRLAAIFHRAGSMAQGSVAAATLRLAVQAEPISSGRTWFGATTPELQAVLSPVLAQPVEPAPWVNWFLEDAHEAPEDGVVRVGFLGTLRTEKGSAAISPLVHALAQPDATRRFVIQVHGLPKIPQDIAALADRADVELLTEWLPDEAMDRLVRSMDLLILPYDRSVYRTAASGLLTLAGAYGVPVVMPSDTWMSAQLEAGRVAGFAYEEDPVSSIAAAAERALQALPELRRRARSQVDYWLQNYSGRGLVERIFSWAEVPRRP